MLLLTSGVTFELVHSLERRSGLVLDLDQAQPSGLGDSIQLRCALGPGLALPVREVELEDRLSRPLAAHSAVHEQLLGTPPRVEGRSWFQVCELRLGPRFARSQGRLPRSARDGMLALELPQQLGDSPVRELMATGARHGMLAREVPEQGGHAGSDNADGEALFEAAARRPSERNAQLTVLDEPAQARCQRGRVAGRGEQRVVPVLNDLRHASIGLPNIMASTTTTLCDS
jgi:hypothetical protein